VTARLRVEFAGPYVSFQDAGRPGNLRFGVPRSGPMDRLAHAAANVAVGNEADGTAIEVSMGGLVVECVEGAVTMAVTGGGFLDSWNAITLHAGDRLAVQAGAWGSWAYVAVLGDFVVPRWLGHTATHSMSGFGGGTLLAGHEIDVANARTDRAREGEIPFPEFARSARQVRVVMGPQDQHFKPQAITAFCETTYALTNAYDRMGVRLSGATLPLQGALSIPSEPILRGSVQVGGDEIPTVLLADHQTTGGYPKIATVISADMDGLSQLRSGDNIEFEPVTPAEAVTIARRRAVEVRGYLDEISKPGRTLAHRLMQENLISWDPEL
jgi:biotin-dependent carboxylase-like uncharacterized protein